MRSWIEKPKRSFTLTHTGGATAQQRFCRVAVDWQKLDRKSAAAAFLPQKIFPNNPCYCPERCETLPVC